MKAFLSLFFMTSFWLLADQHVEATEIQPQEVLELKLATPVNEGVFTLYQKDVFQELGKRTGIKFTIVELPKKRALIDANNGHMDGLAARIRGIEKTDFTDLRIVDVSHFTVQHLLFAKRQDIKEEITDIESLINKAATLDYNVGFMRGSKKAQSLLIKLSDNHKSAFDSAETAFLRIEKGRLGAFIGGPGIVTKALLKEKFSQSGIGVVSILSETELFPYLHVKHARLISKIEHALKSMKMDQTLDRIRKRFE